MLRAVPAVGRTSLRQQAFPSSTGRASHRDLPASRSHPRCEQAQSAAITAQGFQNAGDIIANSAQQQQPYYVPYQSGGAADADTGGATVGADPGREIIGANQPISDERGKRDVADSSSKNAVSFSSARSTKRFPLSRCASAIQIVRPPKSIAETQPQLNLAFLRLSAIISEYFTKVRDFCLPVLRKYWKEIT